MSANIYGLNPGEIHPMGDFQARESEHGSWEANQTYRIIASDMDNDAVRGLFTVGRQLVELWPQCPIVFQTLGMLKSQPYNVPGGFVDIACTFTGALHATYGIDQSAPTQAIQTYTLEGTLEESSIMEHPAVRALPAIDKQAISGVLHLGWLWSDQYGLLGEWNEGDFVPLDTSSQPNSGTAEEWVKRASNGTHTYKRASFIWRETSEGDTGLTTSEIGDLGKINAPPGSPPKPAGTDWLLVGATQETQGTVYRTSREWLLSDSDGWDTNLYS